MKALNLKHQLMFT